MDIKYSCRSFFIACGASNEVQGFSKSGNAGSLKITNFNCWGSRHIVFLPSEYEKVKSNLI